ncbi:MAG TPA: hypothetical protein VFP29_12500 [Methyloceanibacter sp.]|nr:hypothetical protein [Methyloceanibacter sp.]
MNSTAGWFVIIAFLVAVAAFVYVQKVKDKRDNERSRQAIADAQRADREARAKWALEHPGEVYPADLPPPEEA